MKKQPNKQGLALSRVEIVLREYNSKGQIIKEEWQYFFPEDVGNEVKGFSSK